MKQVNYDAVEALKAEWTNKLEKIEREHQARERERRIRESRNTAELVAELRLAKFMIDRALR